MTRAKRIIVARKRLAVSQEKSAVARWEFGQIGPHDLFVRTIEAITDADTVRSLEHP